MLSLFSGISFQTRLYISLGENTLPCSERSRRRISYSFGVSVTGSPSTVTFFGSVVQFYAAADECFGFNVSSSEAEISAQMRAHAGADFDGIERLCYVVVRADVETQNLIGVFAFRREKNHGNIAYLPDFGKGGHTVLDGHHYVHKNKVYVFPFDNAQSLFAIACGIEFI